MDAAWHLAELVQVEKATGRQVLTPAQAAARFEELDEEARVD